MAQLCICLATTDTDQKNLCNIVDIGDLTRHSTSAVACVLPLYSLPFRLVSTVDAIDSSSTLQLSCERRIGYTPDKDPIVLQESIGFGLLGGRIWTGELTLPESYAYPHTQEHLY